MHKATRRVVTRAPTRIDLGGGWTDVPPYCEREGGFVCNIAIDRHATATAATMDADVVPSSDPLVAAAVRRSSLRSVRVSLESDFPVGAGLGGSAAASAATLGALRAWHQGALDLCDIAEEGRVIEVEDLGVAGGRQDHYAATHGGALALTFTDSVEVRKIDLSEETRREFERRAMLVYTGESRISGATITAVLDAYRAGESKVLNSLANMKNLARLMADAVGSGDLDELGRLVGEHWVYQRSLHPAIPTDRIDRIAERAAAAGACGSKAMGASGGGTVLVIAAGDNVEQVRRAVLGLGTEVPFRLDLDGLVRLS